MLFGAQVRQAGGLLAALGRAEAMGAQVMQVFAQSPRQWRYPEANPERAAAFAAVWPGQPDGARRALPRAVPDQPGRYRPRGCRLILENTAGAGGTIGRTFEELALVIQAAGGDPRLGVCLDTQHLWASGVAFRTVPAADRVVDALDATIGHRLACLHANDSRVPLGAGLDRHENIGEGAIGKTGFRALLGHPRLQGLPAILEVPGVDGHGPGATELAAVRRLHAEGLARRRRRRGGGVTVSADGGLRVS